MYKKHLLYPFGFLLMIMCFSHNLNAQSANQDTSSITVDRENAKPVVLHVADLAKFRQIDAKATDRDGKEHVYTGVAISDVLQYAGVAMGKQLRGENMPQYMLAKSGDGYQVLYSLPELDSAFNEHTIMLVNKVDGLPLPEGKGPFRIIAPGEKKPARWIWEVRTLIVRFAKD